MYNVTLSQLRTTILQRCHMENSAVCTTPELNQYINDSGTELADLLARAFGSRYTLKRQQFALRQGVDTYPLALGLTFNTGTVAFGVNLVVTGGTSGAKGTVRAITGSTAAGTLALSDVSGAFQAGETITDTGGGSAHYASDNGGIGAADFLMLHGLDVQTNGQRWLPVSEFMLAERAMFQLPTFNLGALGPLFAYRFQGANLVFAPVPANVYQIQMFYTPTWVQLVNDTDVVDVVDGWHELVIVDGCIKVLAKQDLPADIFMQQKGAMLQRIEALKQQRDASFAPRIIDVSESAGGAWPPTTWNRFGVT